MRYLRLFWQRWRVAIVVALVTVGLALNAWAITRYLTPNPAPSPSATETTSPTATPVVLNTPTPTPTAISSSPASLGKPQLGHFPYAEGDRDKMYAIGSYGQKQNQRFEWLMPEAALALMKLTYAARDDGIWIVPVSGFRSIEKQKELFDAQVQKQGSIPSAAKLSAPPGYSEHHTGYAVDIADGRFPKKDVAYEFAETEAFQWLQRHASEFGFELSFPERNPQGVSYEPWHWRYVGSPVAREIFQQAR
jgi:D-alanyl-D-alanine carboxypeptidase